MKLDYASAIISLRIKLNLSQMALADLLGVSFTSVNRWENGKYSPTKLAKKKIELLCRENDIQIVVFDMNVEGNISKAYEDSSIGTLIKK